MTYSRGIPRIAHTKWKFQCFLCVHLALITSSSSIATSPPTIVCRQTTSMSEREMSKNTPRGRHFFQFFCGFYCPGRALRRARQSTKQRPRNGLRRDGDIYFLARGDDDDDDDVDALVRAINESKRSSISYLTSVSASRFIMFAEHRSKRYNLCSSQRYIYEEHSRN